MSSKQLTNVGQQLQRNPFLPHASGSVQTHQSHNFPSTGNNLQITQGVGPQNHNFLINAPVQHAHKGQQRFVSPMVDGNASRQIATTSQQVNLCLPHASTSLQTQNPSPAITNFKDRHGNMPQSKNWKGIKRMMSHIKAGKSNAAVNSGPRNSTKFKKKKVRTLKYTIEEIKQWTEDRKKHYPKSVQKSKDEETSILRRQELKKILVK